MRTQTQHTAYSEALNIVTSLGAEVDRSFDTVHLERSGERWSILFRGDKSPALNSLIRLFNGVHTPEMDVENDLMRTLCYLGHMGRVRVSILVAEHKVRRSAWSSGVHAPESGLW